MFKILTTHKLGFWSVVRLFGSVHIPTENTCEGFFKILNKHEHFFVLFFHVDIQNDFLDIQNDFYKLAIFTIVGCLSNILYNLIGSPGIIKRF